jgi:predicted PurR-regulated permease PerM
VRATPARRGRRPAPAYPDGVGEEGRRTGPEGIRRAGNVAWATVGLAALLALAGYLAWVVRIIWPPLIFAGAIVFLLNPLVTLLERRGMNRLLGVALTYLALLSVSSLAVLAMAPVAVSQVDDLVDDWPEIQSSVERWINDRAVQSESWFISLPTVGEIEDEVRAGGDQRTLGDRLDQARDIGLRVFNVVLVLVLGPVLAFYLLVDLPRLRHVTLGLVPAGSRREALHVAHLLNRAIGGFFRGQLVVATIVGLLVSAALAVLDLPFWLLVGMIAGFSNIVPLIGPVVGAVPALLIALTMRDVATALWVVGIMVAVQQLESQVISPVVMNRAVKLQPAAVLLALVAGGSLLGFAGLLLAVPTVAVLKILVGHVWHTHVLGEPFETYARRIEVDESDPGVGLVRNVLRADEDGAEAPFPSVDEDGAESLDAAPDGAEDRYPSGDEDGAGSPGGDENGAGSPGAAPAGARYPSAPGDEDGAGSPAPDDAGSEARPPAPAAGGAAEPERPAAGAG